MTRATDFGGSELTIILPGTWAAIPLDDEDAAQSRVAALIKNQVGRSDRLARVRRDARDQLLRAVADARRGKAFSFAMSMEILPGVPFPASMIMGREGWPAPAAPTPETPRASADAVGDAKHESDVAADADAALREQLQRSFPAASALELESGPAVRTTRLQDVTYESEQAPELIADYWLPTADRSALVRVHINAPMAQLPDLYLELFDAMMDSISFRTRAVEPS